MIPVFFFYPRVSLVPKKKNSYNKQLAADAFFFVFAAVFGVCRLYIFPKFLILSVWKTTVLSNFTRLFFCGLLCTLLVLHVFW